jgi:hypothetical protein
LISCARLDILRGRQRMPNGMEWNGMEWNHGIMESWNHGIMESWNHGIMESCNA